MAKREQIVEMIRRRSADYGFDPDLAVRIAELESSLDPNARNRRSSASGLFQLTDARRREIGAPPKRALSLDEQVDYGLKSLSQAAKYLEERLERAPQPYEIYAAHFSGPLGSLKVLKSDQRVPIDRVLSRKAMAANPDLKGKTVGEVQLVWQQKLGDFASQKVQPVAPKEFTPGPPLDVFEREKPAGLQLYAQAPGQEPSASEGPVAMEPQEPVALMASGGMVGDDDSPFNVRLAQMVNAARSDSDFARINQMLSAGPEGFSEGGEAKKMLAEMDEPTPEELERASKAAFGVVPSSGKGRKQSRVSEALQSGEAQLAAAKGMTMLPQNVVGAPVDLATLVARPFGYRVEKPFMGSEYLKEKTRAAGLAFEEPTDPTLRAFFTAGDISSNLVNPAGATRTAARGLEKTGQAARMLAQAAAQDPTVARTVERAIERVAPAATPMYAVRPPGGGVPNFPESTPSSKNTISLMENWVAEGLEGAKKAPASPEVTQAMQNFWNTKATNYITRQIGTPDDPILKQILSGSLTTPQLEKEFRRYAIEQAKVGKTKVNPETGEERFYPKYPEVVEDLTRKYDEMTGISPVVVSKRPEITQEGRSWLTTEADALAGQKQQELIDKLLAAGVPFNQVNVPRVNLAAKLPDGSMGSTTYQSAVPTALVQGAEFQGPMQGGRLQSSEAIRRAIANEEPVYDIRLQKPLNDVLMPPYINEYLATLTPKEISKTRFEDVVRDSAKYRLKQFERETLVADIKAGRPVNNKFFAEGVSAPLLQIKEGPLEGFAWKRIEDAEATAAEGAYVGHSVGGYASKGAYGPEKHRLFNEGKYRVYTLRDNRNRPVTTVEVKMENDSTPIVTQIKGNGRATGNTAPVKYDEAVEQFFRDYLKPERIEESSTYLTPRLQNYRTLLNEERSRKNTEKHLREMHPDVE